MRTTLIEAIPIAGWPTITWASILVARRPAGRGHFRTMRTGVGDPARLWRRRKQPGRRSGRCGLVESHSTLPKGLGNPIPTMRRVREQLRLGLLAEPRPDRRGDRRTLSPGAENQARRRQGPQQFRPRSCSRCGRLTEAIYHLQRALEIKPDFAVGRTVQLGRGPGRPRPRSPRRSPIFGEHWKSSPTMPRRTANLRGLAAERTNRRGRRRVPEGRGTQARTMPAAPTALVRPCNSRENLPRRSPSGAKRSGCSRRGSTF